MISVEEDTPEEERGIRPHRGIIIITGTAGEYHYRQAIEAMLKEGKHNTYTVAAHPSTFMSTTIKEKPLSFDNPKLYKLTEEYEPEPKYDKPKSKFHK